ncbi:MAG: nucleotide sugar dehydrogenase [Sulfolobales archaeon]
MGIYHEDLSMIDNIIRERRIKISLYGLGYIGAATAAAFIDKGFKVVGYDADPERARNIEKGSIKHPDPEVRDAVRRGVEKGLLEVVYDPIEASRKGDIIIIDVPLSWGARGPLFIYLDNAVENIARGLSPGHIVVVETTVPPGTTSTRVKGILERVSGLRCGSDFGLAYSPARLSIEKAYGDLTRRYPKILGGVDPRSPSILEKLFREVYGGVLIMSSATAAEFEKVAEGIYRDVNIALANELARAARELGIDIWEVITAASTNPYIHIHMPGSGVGGVSLPYQPYLLAWSIGGKWIWEGVIMRGRKVNEDQPRYIAKTMLEGLEILGIRGSEAKIAILGLAYKGDVDDHRNSPSYSIIEYLASRGVGEVVLHDPYVETPPSGIKIYRDLEESLRGCDGVILSTDHSIYRGLSIEQIAILTGKKRVAILDSRRVLRREGRSINDIECIYSTSGSPWSRCFPPPQDRYLNVSTNYSL